MSGSGSNLDSEGRRALLEAVDLANVAVDFLVSIVQPDTGRRQARRGSGLIDRLLALAQPSVVAPPDQLRRCCVALDQLAGGLEQLSVHVTDPDLGDAIVVARTWSDRAWEANDNVPLILDEIRRVNDRLTSYQRNLTLGRPLW